MPQCPQCQADTKEGQRFCKACGATLTGGGPKISPEPSTSSPGGRRLPSEAKPRKSSSVLLILAAIGGVLILGGGIIGLVWFYNLGLLSPQVFTQSQAPTKEKSTPGETGKEPVPPSAQTREEKPPQVAVEPQPAAPEKPLAKPEEPRENATASLPEPEKPSIVPGREPPAPELGAPAPKPPEAGQAMPPSPPPESVSRPEVAMPVPQAPGPEPAASAGPRWPWTSERFLTDQDLQSIPRQDLVLMRNEIYARHGWIFRRQDLRDYFGRQPWYRPKGDLANGEQVNRRVQAELTPIEKKNVQTILSREKVIR